MQAIKRHIENLPQMYHEDGHKAIIEDFRNEIHLKISVNNDLEAMFESTSREQIQASHLHQKLKGDELKLAKSKDPDKWFQLFLNVRFQIFDLGNMDFKDSQSESRYAFLYCLRKTTMLQDSAQWLHDARKHRNQQFDSGKPKKSGPSKKKSKRKR